MNETLKTIDRDQVLLEKSAAWVGKIVLLNDRDDFIEARERGKHCLPTAAIVTGIAVDEEGRFTGLNLVSFQQETGVMIRKNVAPSPPSDQGDEPGWFEAPDRIGGGEPSPVQFSLLQSLVAQGIRSELAEALQEQLPDAIKAFLDAEGDTDPVKNVVKLAPKKKVETKPKATKKGGK